jgi:hypothetical protein
MELAAAWSDKVSREGALLLATEWSTKSWPPAMIVASGRPSPSTSPSAIDVGEAGTLKLDFRVNPLGDPE